jgi:hypothetical protein
MLLCPLASLCTSICVLYLTRFCASFLRRVSAAHSRMCSCRLQQPSWQRQVHRDHLVQQQQQRCSLVMMGCCSHRR